MQIISYFSDIAIEAASVFIDNILYYALYKWGRGCINIRNVRAVPKFQNIKRGLLDQTKGSL